VWLACGHSSLLIAQPHLEILRAMVSAAARTDANVRALRTLKDVSPSALPPPPGLGDSCEDLHEVRISGIPNKLLSKPMVEAMLHQAHIPGPGNSAHHINVEPAPLDDVLVGFRILGRPSRLVVTFSCEAAARRCATHFHGRRWGNAPAPLVATVAPLRERGAPVPAMVSQDTAFCAKASAYELSAFDLDAPAYVHPHEVTSTAASCSSETLLGSSASAQTGLSARAPAWQPQRTRLTASAPAFVPGALGVDMYAAGAGFGTVFGQMVKHERVASDTTTDPGESGDDESPALGCSPAVA